MSIRVKLMLLTFPPLLVILGLGAQNLMRSHERATRLSRISQLADVAVDISSLVHELQKERGRTAGYLGSSGAMFNQELSDQREMTDEKLSAFRGRLEDFDASQFGGAFQDRLSDSIGDLADLSSTRRAVSSLDLTTPEAIGYYTTMNGKLLGTIGAMTALCDDASTANQVETYLLFLRGKERAGIERAVLSNTFAADKFGDGMYRKFVTLVAEQDTYMREFLDLASEQSGALYRAAINDPSVADVESMRAVAFEKRADGGFGIDPSVWFSTITRKINKLKSVEDSLSASLKDNIAAEMALASRTRLLVGSLTLVVVFVCIAGAFLISRSINRPIATIIAGITRIEESNDLTSRVEYTGNDELGRLASTFNILIGTLEDIISTVLRSSGEVAAAATQFAATSDVITRGMAEQSQQVDQINSAMDQISESVLDIAGQTEQAANDASAAGSAAEGGRERVDRTIANIGEIKQAVELSTGSVNELREKSELISTVVGTINDIADQTNLLALNAAIEAARAGAHGRGFAIVAGEVRKLAERTTQATQEISNSILGIQRETSDAVKNMQTGTGRVETGVAISMEAGDSLRQIVEISGQLACKVQSIAAAAQEQSATMQQVASSTESISGVTRDALSGARESSEASRQLSEQAEALRELVSRFKTSH